ncbi:MAG: MarR family transcriptional regulator [Lachnospiraceae bacterium]|nr:MarR family transcriptional regulator [Lachnospiraceae bacterium]
MKLEWMGEYRDVVEALIHYCNIYAAAYKKERLNYNGIRYSYAQIQVLEYLLENEDEQQNMSSIAKRLGITRSSFTKIVSRLVEKGLLEKSYMPGSRKAMLITINETGRALYEAYSKSIYDRHFSRMFEQLKNLPREYYDVISNSLYEALHGSGYTVKPRRK